MIWYLQALQYGSGSTPVACLISHDCKSPKVPQTVCGKRLQRNQTKTQSASSNSYTGSQEATPAPDSDPASAVPKQQEVSGVRGSSPWCASPVTHFSRCFKLPKLLSRPMKQQPFHPVHVLWKSHHWKRMPSGVGNVDFPPRGGKQQVASLGGPEWFVSRTPSQPAPPPRRTLRCALGSQVA